LRKQINALTPKRHRAIALAFGGQNRLHDIVEAQYVSSIIELQLRRTSAPQGWIKARASEGKGLIRKGIATLHCGTIAKH
jgi:exosome complex RNA-binding protein Csl4